MRSGTLIGAPVQSVNRVTATKPYSVRAATNYRFIVIIVG